MEDTPALFHCRGPLCADEIAQPASKFFWIQRNRSRFCRRCCDRASHDLPTRFDRELARLGLTGQERAWAESKDLRRWAARNASACYVPERLLTTWRIPVTLDL
jgi:hypothetical protein